MKLDPPEPDSDPKEMADWLELVAVLSPDGIANLDLLSDAFDFSEDTENENIADGDQKREARIESVTEQFKSRLGALEVDAYPFSISNNGERINLAKDMSYGQSAYIICLLLNHSWHDGKLLPPSKLTSSELSNGRTMFEVLSAVAAIGYADGGPSFLIGSNRSGGEALLKRLKVVCDKVGEGRAKTVLDDAAPPHANDDGIDVISVELECDGPPHRAFYFCQAASGADFVNKSAKSKMERFLELWMDARPANPQGVMFVPLILNSDSGRRYSFDLGQMCHRLRMPRYTQSGHKSLTGDKKLLQFVDDVNAPIKWLQSYRDRIQAGAH